jgi:uncharacterized repeat protein (TIGR01451 family)
MKIASVFSRLPKKTYIAVTALALALLSGVAVTAWSPNRPTYTIENPADHVTFNSITNNPVYGDERAFFAAKDAANTTEGGFSHAVKVQDGMEVYLRAYVHNNASSSLNGSDYTGTGVAKNARARFNIPTGSDKNMRVNAYISADNAAPKEVQDNLDLIGDSAFTLEYVPGSAVSYTKIVPTGIKIDDSIVTTGALIGWNSANGLIPGCLEYDSIVMVKVKVKMPQPNYSMKKMVAIPGQAWSESVAAKPGDTLSFLLEFKNTGNTALNDMIVRDNLPAGMSYVPGTTVLANGDNPNGVNYGDGGVAVTQANGIAVGNYAAGTTGYVKFKAKVNDTVPCGTTTLTNYGGVYPKGMPETLDTANVVVTKSCVTPTPTPTPTTTPTPTPTPTVTPTPTPAISYRCDALRVSKTNAGINEALTFTAVASTQNATITGYVFKVNGTTVQDGTSNTYTFNQGTAGKYTVTAQVKTNRGTSEIGACSKVVTVAAAQAVYSCDALNVDRSTLKIGEAANFVVSASAQNAQIQGYLFKVNGQVKQDGTSNSFVFKDYVNGTYTVTAQVKTDKGTSEVGKCTKQITVQADQTASYTCDSLKVSAINRTKALFTAKGTATNATITGYIFKVNGQTKQDSTNDSYTLSEETPGTYTVTAYVKTDKGTSPVSQACTKTYEVEAAPQTPVRVCRAVKIDQLGNRKVRATTETRAENGASVKNYIIDFGDRKSPVVTDKNPVEYTYDADGTYVVRVKVTFAVPGEADEIIESADCVVPATVTKEVCALDSSLSKDDAKCVPCPYDTKILKGDARCVAPQVKAATVLPNTGAGSLVGAFAGVSAFGTVAHRAFSLRKKRR